LALVEIDRVVDDTTQLVENLALVVAVASAEDQAGRAADAEGGPDLVVDRVRVKISAAGRVMVEQLGEASWSGAWHHGRPTASGARFDEHALTAAHPTLPLGTRATVTNLATGASVDVVVNDRGPYVYGRDIDLSRAAAEAIGVGFDIGVRDSV
jgi:rare lipoprotein A